MTHTFLISRGEITEALEAIPSGARVFVCGHTRPDGDSMGSVLALTRALRLRNINATPLLADNCTAPMPYQWMTGCEDFATPESLLASAESNDDDTPQTATQAPLTSPPAKAIADFFIAVDTPDFGRLNEAGRLLKLAEKSLVIDHHPAVRETYADLHFTDPSIAATGQLIWLLLRTMDWQVDEHIATACYVSTLTDTGSFQFSNANEATFLAVSDMIKAGAEPAKIAKKLFSQKPLAALHLEGRILSRAKRLNGGAVIHSYLSDADLQELGVAVDFTEDLVDLIRSARDTDVTLFITESSKGPRVSLRSNNNFDVSTVAQHFGGGGHRAAAGIAWPDKAAGIDQILEDLLPHLPKHDEPLDDGEPLEWKYVEAPPQADNGKPQVGPLEI